MIADPRAGHPATIEHSGPVTDHEAEVLRRYGAGAERSEPELCCPISYDPKYLELVPREIIEKDYGCGDPSAHVNPGETVLDLGSGGGKICYILAQRVGAAGRVIGVDFNDAMLGLARKYQDEMAAKVGYANVSFHKAKIQDLALDLDELQEVLEDHPIRSVEQLATFEATCDRLRREQPLIADASVDVIVSNCVLNLVRPPDKAKLFAEMFRVLRPGGRAVIADVVCDEDPTPAILEDPELWSGCIAGAFREDRFLEMFRDAGFQGLEIVQRQAEPWQLIDGIEFRSVTVRAYRGAGGPCLERHQAVIYKGPFQSVRDDDGHVFERGLRTAVCDKTFNLLKTGPYAKDMVFLEPTNPVPLDEAESFDCSRTFSRHPRELKEVGYQASGGDSTCCSTDAGCY